MERIGVIRVRNPRDAVKPIHDFAVLLNEDLETKEALRLFAEDEYSTAKWAQDACAALSTAAPAAADRSSASAEPARTS